MAGVVLGLYTPAGAARAEADVLLTPFVGVTFGGDAARNQDSYGVSLGGMTGGIFGFELDVGHTRDLFHKDPSFGDDDVTTLTANVLVGTPIGPIRPYVAGGMGLIRSSFDPTSPGASRTHNALGIDVGAGVLGFFTQHIGARADLRYFRNVSGGDDNVVDFDLGNLGFWRGSVGVTFRF